jgi:hypothetical protein
MVQHNTTKTHAEMELMELMHDEGWDQPCAVMSIRVTKRGELANARPCIDCARWLSTNSLIQHVYYSNAEGQIARLY